MELRNISLFKNKNKLINIGLIVLSLIIAKSIYSSQIKNMNTLRSNKEIELKKNALVNDISKIEKRINAYKKAFPKSDTSSIINSIAQLAGNSQIKITSIRPEAEREYSTYNRLSIRVSIIAVDYNRIGDFVSKLENAAQFYTIESLTIRPLFSTNEADNRDRLSADLILTAIIFKG